MDTLIKMIIKNNNNNNENDDNILNEMSNHDNILLNHILSQEYVYLFFYF
jgi:hypothetical protein